MGVVCLLERGSGWRPRTLGCSSAAEAKPVERGTDADDELAVERVVRGVEVKNEFPSPSDASAAAAP